MELNIFRGVPGLTPDETRRIETCLIDEMLFGCNQFDLTDPNGTRRRIVKFAHDHKIEPNTLLLYIRGIINERLQFITGEVGSGEIAQTLEEAARKREAREYKRLERERQQNQEAAKQSQNDPSETEQKPDPEEDDVPF